MSDASLVYMQEFESGEYTSAVLRAAGWIQLQQEDITLISLTGDHGNAVVVYQPLKKKTDPVRSVINVNPADAGTVLMPAVHVDPTPTPTFDALVKGKTLSADSQQVPA